MRELGKLEIKFKNVKDIKLDDELLIIEFTNGSGVKTGIRKDNIESLGWYEE